MFAPVFAYLAGPRLGRSCPCGTFRACQQLIVQIHLILADFILSLSTTSSSITIGVFFLGITSCINIAIQVSLADAACTNDTEETKSRQVKTNSVIIQL